MSVQFYSVLGQTEGEVFFWRKHAGPLREITSRALSCYKRLDTFLGNLIIFLEKRLLRTCVNSCVQSAIDLVPK